MLNHWREALQQPLHELAQVVHPVGVARVDRPPSALVGATRPPSPCRASASSAATSPTTASLYSARSRCSNSSSVNPALRHRRHFQQQVDVVAHQAVGQHPAAREVLIHPHQGAELLLLVLPERKPPLHHPRDAVVKHRLHLRILPRGKPAFSACHAPCLPHPFPGRKRFLIKGLSIYILGGRDGLRRSDGPGWRRSCRRYRRASR